jgi:hypothetical protein
MPLHHERRGRERECQAQALGAEIPIALPPAGRAAMVTDEECVDYAREWVRLAGLTADEEIRGQLLSMAREWMAAAMHERHSAVRARRT